MASGKKKPPGFWRWRFCGFLGLSLAGSLRQLAGIKEEAEKVKRHVERHEAVHRLGLCHKTIWVHRKSAIGRDEFAPLASWVTTASQTCVVRPRCTGVARQAMVPSRAVPRKFALSSSVVKPLAP